MFQLTGSLLLSPRSGKMFIEGKEGKPSSAGAKYFFCPLMGPAQETI
jgi:hypothetical protein